MPVSVLHMRTVNHRHVIKLPAPPTQPAPLLQANATFFAVKLNACMPGSCTKKRKVIFFMNINQQTVSHNLKGLMVGKRAGI